MFESFNLPSVKMNPGVTVLSFLLIVGAAHFTEAHPASQEIAFRVVANAASSPRQYNSYLGEKLLHLLAKLKTEVEAKIEVAGPEVKAALVKIRDAVDDLIKKAGVAIGGGFLLTILEMLNLGGPFLRQNLQSSVRKALA